MKASTESEALQFVEINLLTGANRRFFFRRSGTDLSVIRQIFEQQNYNLSGFPLSDRLKSYANRVASGPAVFTLGRWWSGQVALQMSVF